MLLGSIKGGGLKLPAWKVGDRGFDPTLAFKFQRNKMFLSRSLVKIQYYGEPLWPFSASDRQGSNFESCVWRAVSSHSSRHPQEVLLAQFGLYVHIWPKTPFIHYLCAYEAIPGLVNLTFFDDVIALPVAG